MAILQSSHNIYNFLKQWLAGKFDAPGNGGFFLCYTCVMKTIGIWGFGVVGKAALTFFTDARVLVWDEKELGEQDQQLIAQHGATYVHGTSDEFLDQCDEVLPSPGIAIGAHYKHSSKFLNELDLFANSFSGKTIAITGTLGKTTVTHQLGLLLQMEWGEQVAIAGNIGVGMLAVSHTQKKMCVLELSSFQLEHSRTLAPDIAIWTNIYPNHLDRHETHERYFNAKFRLLQNQRSGQVAIISPQVAQHELFKAREHELECQVIVAPAYDNSLFPPGFHSNWCLVAATLNHLNISCTYDKLSMVATNQEHRLQHVAQVDGVDFYNDSKATVPEATIGAIMQLTHLGRPIRVILGGQSKGADRAQLREVVHNTSEIAEVFCFGGERASFEVANEFATLGDAFSAAVAASQPGDIVLFSPSGASFDLYNNYKERGEAFCRLVKNIE